MQGNNEPGQGFSDFLSEHRARVLIILIIALVAHIAFTNYHAPMTGDAGMRYLPTARNILSGNGFSLDSQEPYRPSEACVPLYPLFIAALYRIFGPHENSIVFAQIFLDLLNCLLVAFVSFRLAPKNLKAAAALFSLMIYGIFSWFTMVWAVMILTETLTIFFTLLTIVFCILALEKTGHNFRYYFLAGAVCALAILTRPDSMLLLIAVGLFLSVHFFLNASRANAFNLLGFGFALVLLLAPWTVRNYMAFGKFQPLASEWGFAQPKFMAKGYLNWAKTWIYDEYNYALYNLLDPPFSPGSIPLRTESMPDDIFDSADERRRVAALAEQYNQNSYYFTPEIDAGFQKIADERISRSPARFYVILPLKRVAALWMAGLPTKSPTTYVRIFSVVIIMLGGLAGFILWGKQSFLTLLLLFIILVRTVFLAYHYAPEIRYIVEAHPPMIAFCGITCAALWVYAKTFFGWRIFNKV